MDQQIEDVFAWIRNEMQKGVLVTEMANPVDATPLQVFILKSVKEYYDESAPPGESIDIAEAQTRGILSRLIDSDLPLEGLTLGKVGPRWRRHFRVVEVVYDANQITDENPETTDLATLARMIEEGQVHGSEMTQQEIPEALAREFVAFEGIRAESS